MIFIRRDVAYMACILPTVFIVGVSAPRVMSPSTSSPMAIATWLICCAAAIALMVNCCRHWRNNSPAVLRGLALEAHRQVVRLVGDGFDRMAPCDRDRKTTSLLRIRMDGENVVIEKVTWRDTCHVYTISPTARIKREIFGSRLTWSDRRWCNAPLTAARLEYLVRVLQSTYSPRKRVEA